MAREPAGSPFVQSGHPATGNTLVQIRWMGFSRVMGVFDLRPTISGIVVVNLLVANLVAQAHQIGVTKATGGARGHIERIYFAQALLLGIVAALSAPPLGMLAGRA